jgi:hypothetical protein
MLLFGVGGVGGGGGVRLVPPMRRQSRVVHQRSIKQKKHLCKEFFRIKHSNKRNQHKK